jgi:hypothetical protein
MADWQEVFKDDLETEEVFDQGAPEVTLFPGYHVVWAGVRPEMDIKDKERGHTEVHLGRFSGVGFHVHNTFRWYLISDPIDVDPTKSTRASAALMVVSHGIGGDASRAGDCGMRVGLVNADDVTVNEARLVSSPQDADAESVRVVAEIEGAEENKRSAWSEWWGVRGSLENERKWVVRTTKTLVPRGEQVRLIIQCNADLAAAISAGHYDDLMVEQDMASSHDVLPPLDRETLLRVAAALREQADILTRLAG